MSVRTLSTLTRWKASTVAFLLLAFATPAYSQQAVSGRVTAASTGEPLSAVIVQVQGTQVGVRTGEDGRYTVAAPTSSGVLVFSRLGYVRQEAPFSAGQTTVDVAMAVAPTSLESVVVIGYGEKTRTTLTESVGSVSRADIKQVPVASPEVALQGRVSGTQVTAESGVPGAPVAVRIRGVGTVGNTQPLYVVDGLPVGRGESAQNSPLTTLNPDDIESISVLKDASAAAIYGVQAANGVVLITTRKGSTGRPGFEYSGYYGVQNLAKKYDMLNSAQWFALGQESFDNYNAQFGYRDTTNSSFRRFTPWLSARQASLQSINTDWMDVITEKNAPIINQYLSVSGSGDRSRFFVSGGFFQQNPIITKYDLRRLSFRVNSDYKLRDRLRFGETFSIAQATTLRGENNGFNQQLIRSSLNLPPFFQFRDVNHSVTGNRYGFTGNTEFATNAGLQFTNEPAYNLLSGDRNRNLSILGGVNGEIDLLKNLTLKSLGSVDLGFSRDNAFQPNIRVREIGLDRPDYLSEQRGDSWTLLWQNTLNYNQVFGQHSFSLLGGTEYNQNHYTGTQVSTSCLITTANAFREVPTAGSCPSNPPASWAGMGVSFSYLGRLNYNFAERYLFTGSLRRDGSSNFAPENRWGTFPSFSAGWRVSQEPFFHVPGVSELKLRGSWGRLGNSDIPASYPHIFQVTTTPDYGLNGSTVVKAPVPVGFVNRNLIWETSEASDFGFESGFLEDRLTFAATYYRRDTKNFLINVPLPWTSGFPGGAPVNSGNVRNTGFELESGYSMTAPGQVDLRFNANLTTVKNRLVSLRKGIQEYSAGGGYRTAVGQPIDYFYGYKTCGIYRTEAAAAAAPKDQTIGINTQHAGDVCFVDVNKDGKIDPKDRTYIGKTIPDFYYGFTTTAGWRKFDASLFFSGVSGIQKYNLMRQTLASVSGGGSNRSTEVLNHWTPQNPNAPLPRAIVGDPSGNDRFSDRWVEDADYFRLRNVQIGYALPAGMFGLNSARIYVAGTNIFTVTPYKGLDPEFTTAIDYVRSRNGVQQQSGTDMGAIPQPRTFQFGVNTSF